MRGVQRRAGVAIGAAIVVIGAVIAAVVLSSGSGVRAEPAAPPPPIEGPVCGSAGPPHPTYDQQQVVTDVLLPLVNAESDLYSGACIDNESGAVMLFVTDAVRGEELVADAREQGAPAAVPIQVAEVPYSERHLMATIERTFSNDNTERFDLVSASPAGNYQGIVLTSRRQLSTAEQEELTREAGLPVLFTIGEGGVPA